MIDTYFPDIIGQNRVKKALEFYIDGQLKFQEGGEIGWTEFQTSIVTGEHTLTWIYDKDSSVSSGSDASWVDNIRIF